MVADTCQFGEDRRQRWFHNDVGCHFVGLLGRSPDGRLLTSDVLSSRFLLASRAILLQGHEIFSASYSGEILYCSRSFITPNSERMSLRTYRIRRVHCSAFCRAPPCLRGIHAVVVCLSVTSQCSAKRLIAGLANAVRQPMDSGFLTPIKISAKLKRGHPNSGARCRWGRLQLATFDK